MKKILPTVPEAVTEPAEVSKAHPTSITQHINDSTPQRLKNKSLYIFANQSAISAKTIVEPTKRA